MQVTALDLSELLRLDAQTGSLFWLERNASHFPKAKNPEMAAYLWNCQHAGKQGFLSTDTRGYAKGSIFGKTYSAHRVVWALHFGQWPEGEIDHIDGIRPNNAISNLRVVDRTSNLRNSGLPSNNKSGRTGVSWNAQTMKWRAYITIANRSVHLGHFCRKEDAIRVRVKAEAEHGFMPNSRRGGQ